MSNPEFKAIPVRLCAKCGATERNASGECKACSKAHKAAYYAANHAQISAKRLAYYLENPDRAKAASLSVAAYYATNKNKEKARKAAYVLANSDRVKARQAAWRVANKDKVRAAAAAWHAANPNARRVNQRNRVARKRENGGVLSQGFAIELFKLQKGMCPCCAQPLGDDYHLDHVIPLALGGANEDWNMQLLRKICNLQKSMKHPVDFMQSRGFLL